MKKTPKNPEPVPPGASDLRRQAEAIELRRRMEAGMARLNKPLAALSPEETQRLIHELQVHQIELELQNDELRRAQSALDESRARYFDLYDFAPVGYATVSEKGVVLESNLAAAALLGVPRGALAGQMLSGFILKEDQDIYYRHRKQLFESGAPQACDLRMQKPDGAIFWVHLEAAAARDDKGGPVCRIVMGDITARRQAEDALRKSEMFFRDMFERHAAVKLIIDPADGTILNANRAAADYYGWPQEQLCRMRIQDINVMSPDEVKREMEKASRRHRTYFEFRHRRADGSVRDVAVFSSNIASAGNPVLHSIVHDITARKLAEDTQAFLLQCGLPSTGEDFFASLARHLAGELGMDYVCIDRLEGDGLMAQTVAVYNGGRFESNVRYALRDTPCGEVLDKRICCFPQGVRQLFPKDAALQDLNAESYFGVTLWDSGGRPVGLIAVIGHRPLVDPQRAEILLGLVAPRAAFELERRVAEEKLQASEATFRSYVESAPLAIFISDAGGRFLDCNPAAAELLGYDVAALRGMGVLDIHPKEDREAVVQAQASLARDGHVKGEFRMSRRDGTTIWVLLNVGMMASGYALGYGQDITARKQAESQRSMSLEVLGILNSMEDLPAACRRLLAVIQREFGIEAAAIRIARDGEFRYFVHAGFPPAFVESEDHLCSHNADGTVQCGPGGRPLLECTCGLVLEGRTDPASPLFSPGGSAWTNDATPFAHIPADQDPRLHPRNRCITEGYKSIALVPVRSGAQIVGLLQLNDRRTGRFSPEQIVFLESLAGSVGIALARWQSGEALRESRSLYDQMAEQNRTISWEVDADGLYTYVSPVAELVLGYPPAEMVGKKHFYDLYPEAGREAFKAAALAVFARKESFRELENPCRTRDGLVVWVVTNGMPVLDARGHLLGYRGSDTDITARKQAEEQLRQAQKMESVGQLAGGVAHDFNNMLGVILGRADLALTQVRPEQPIHADLMEIRLAAQRSADITRQLLTFARKELIMPRVLDLNETVGDMLKMLQRLIGENIQLVWQPGPGLWPVHMDPSQVDQILVNLCVNARDAMAGGGKVFIETGRSAFDAADCAAHAGFVPGDYLRLTVSDTGCGMDKETLAHLFEPFFTTKEVGKGTGLGLATVYGVVTQNNGFINVYSEPGKGTTFNIYLPRHAGQEGATPEQAPAPPDTRGHETILVAEDEPSILRLAVIMLKQMGYTVLAADAPDKALQLARNHVGPVHLLVTDVVMPGMNGQALAKELQALYPHIRCLFMSGYTADIIAHHGVIDKEVHFIQKPFDVKTLAAKVREALDKK